MTLDEALAYVQKSVPDCVAAGFVDMKTGMLLAIETVNTHPQEVLDLVAAATGDLFQGPNVSAIEQMFRRSRGEPYSGHHFFQEIIILSEHLVHVFQRCRIDEDLVLVTVCRVDSDMDAVLSKSRMLLEEVEAAV